MIEDLTNLRIESSPQIRHHDTTSKIMWAVIIALLPSGIWGVINFGWYSLLVIAISLATAAGIEYLFIRTFHKGSLLDGSALLTGLLVAYNMPPHVVLYVPVIATAFAIAVVKWSFGGLGANWINPALAGRAFVFFSWTGSMTSWSAPRSWQAVDSVSGATMLSSVKTGLMDLSGSVAGSSQVLADGGYAVSNAAAAVTGWFQNSLGWSVSPYNIDLFLGNVSGCIGEVSALLLIIGAIYLLKRKIITWYIPVSYIGVFTLLIWIFGGLRYNSGFFSGDVWFHLFSGGLMLGALFMATDMVTSPTTPKGMIIFGAGAGFLTFLFRIYGSLPEGVSLAIILMNIFVPMIDRYIVPKKFGSKKERGAA